MKTIMKYKCDYCGEVFESETQCLSHEKNCLLNEDVWELRWFKCNYKTRKFDGTDIPICSNDLCWYKEHCDGQIVLHVNKITGEIKR